MKPLKGANRASVSRDRSGRVALIRRGFEGATADVMVYDLRGGLRGPFGSIDAMRVAAPGEARGTRAIPGGISHCPFPSGAMTTDEFFTSPLQGAFNVDHQ